MTRIAIDLNVRVRGNLTYSGLDDVEGSLPRNGLVQVYEPESGLVGRGRVVEVDEDTQLVYLQVDWNSLHEVSPFVVPVEGNSAGPHAGVSRHLPVAAPVARLARTAAAAS